MTIISASHYCGTSHVSDYFAVDFKASDLTPHNNYEIESNYKGEKESQLFFFTPTSTTYSNSHARVNIVYKELRISRAKLRVTFVLYNDGPPTVAGDEGRPVQSGSVTKTFPKCQ